MYSCWKVAKEPLAQRHPFPLGKGSIGFLFSLPACWSCLPPNYLEKNFCLKVNFELIDAIHQEFFFPEIFLKFLYIYMYTLKFSLVKELPLRTFFFFFLCNCSYLPTFSFVAVSSYGYLSVSA